MKSPSQSTYIPAKKSAAHSSVHPLKVTCIASAIATLMLGSAHALAEAPNNLHHTAQMQLLSSDSSAQSRATSTRGQLYDSNYTTTLYIGAHENGTLTQQSNISLTNATSYNNVGIEDNATMNLYDTSKVTGLVFIRNNGTLTMHNSSTATGINMVANSRVILNDNATASNTIVNENAMLTLIGTTTANNTNVTGGTMALKGNGIANDSIIIGSGSIDVSDTAKINNTSFSGTGVFSLRGNAKARDTRLNGTMTIDGAEASNTTISSTGSLSVTGSGSAINTQLNGGTMLLIATSQATNTTISSGTMGLTESATANNTTVSGGAMNLINSTIATNTRITGGSVNLGNSSKLNTTTISNGSLTLTGLAEATNTTIAGGSMTLSNTAKAATTTMSNGALSLTDTAEVSGSNVSGGTLSVSGRALASGSNIGSGGTLNLSGAGRTQTTTLAGIMSVSGSASASDTTVASGGRFNIAAGTTIKGIRVDRGGLMQFAANAAAENTNVLTGGNLVFAGNATLSGTTTINGIAKFTAPAAGANYSILTINGDLNGDGTYYMNAHSAVQKGDMIKVTGQANGNNTLFVADSGNEPVAPGQEARLVQIGGGAGSFALQGGTVDVGAFRYKLEQRSKEWVLVRTERSDDVTPGTVSPGTVSPGTVSPGTVSPGTVAPGSILPAGKPTNFSQKNLSKAANAAVASHAATSVALAAQMNALVKRLGELRLGKDDGGMWTRAYVKEQRLDTSSSRAFEQQVSGTEFGLDKAYQLGENKIYVGGLLGLGRAKQDFNEGVKGKVNSFSAGAYTSLIAPDGSYADAVFKYSRFDNEVDFVDNMSLGVKAEHKNTAYMLNLEVGKRIDLSASWFVEPQLELMAMQINGADYAASNGMQVKQASVRSLQSRIGTLVGHNHKMDDGRLLQTYAKASWINEHEGKSKVSINGTSLDSVLLGSRAEIGVGMIVQAADKHKFHVDLEYTKGNEIKQPVALNVGYRYLW